MTAILFISLIVLLIIGVPIAFVLCGSSILAILASGDIHSAIVIQRMFSGLRKLYIAGNTILCVSR